MIIIILPKWKSLYSTLDGCHPASLEYSLRVTAYYLMNLLASFLPSSIWEFPPSLISIPFVLTQSLCFPAVPPSRDAPLLAETQLWEEAPHPTLASPLQFWERMVSLEKSREAARMWWRNSLSYSACDWAPTQCWTLGIERERRHSCCPQRAQSSWGCTESTTLWSRNTREGKPDCTMGCWEHLSWVLKGEQLMKEELREGPPNSRKRICRNRAWGTRGSQVGVVTRNALMSGQQAGACWIYPVWCVSSSSGHSPAVHEWLPDLEKLEAEEYQKHEFRQSSVQENNRRGGGGWAAHREDCSDWPCLPSSKYSLQEGFLPSFLSFLPLSLPPSLL